MAKHGEGRGYLRVGGEVGVPGGRLQKAGGRASVPGGQLLLRAGGIACAPGGGRLHLIAEVE